MPTEHKHTVDGVEITVQIPTAEERRFRRQKNADSGSKLVMTAG